MKGRGSIRWRIQIWQTLLLTALVSILGTFWYQQQKVHLIAEIDHDLRSKMIGVLRQFPHEMRKRNRQSHSNESRADLPRHPRHHNGGRRPHRRSESRNRHDDMPRFAKRIVESNNEVFENSLYSLCAWNEGNIVLEKNYLGDRLMPSIDIPVNGVSRTVGKSRQIVCKGPHTDAMVISYDLTETQDQLTRLIWLIIAVALSVILIGFFIGWLATGRAVRPINEINEVAKNIANGQLSSRISLKDPTIEIASLSKALNNTFETLEGAFEHQRQFTADASHELRNPIAAMLMEVEVAIASGGLDKEAAESLDVCKRNLDEMNYLVQGLLALARLDKGDMNEQKEIVDIGAEIKERCLYFDHQAADKKVQLITKIEVGTCSLILVQFRQILDNLISNALKYGAEGGTVELSCQLVGDMMKIKIKDYGKGISPENLPFIFDRFFRVDEARTFQQKSAGIGLAIVKALVKANAGEISVESVLGQGTEFTLTFKAVR